MNLELVAESDVDVGVGVGSLGVGEGSVVDDEGEVQVVDNFQ